MHPRSNLPIDVEKRERMFPCWNSLNEEEHLCSPRHFGFCSRKNYSFPRPPPDPCPPRLPHETTQKCPPDHSAPATPAPGTYRRIHRLPSPSSPPCCLECSTTTLAPLGPRNSDAIKDSSCAVNILHKRSMSPQQYGWEHVASVSDESLCCNSDTDFSIRQSRSGRHANRRRLTSTFPPGVPTQEG